jgi:hypothetical protein
VRDFLTRRRARSGTAQQTGAANDDAEQALATAEKLAAAQSFSEAIRLLTDSNRTRRDPRLEQRLVELRFDAFREMEWPATRPEWPDTVDDLFPGVRIPEIGRTDLTVERVRSAIRNHGSLIVRGLVDQDPVDRLRADIDRALAAYDATTSGECPPDLAGWYRPFDRDTMSNRERKRFRGAVMMVESPPTIFDLIETFEDSGVGQLLRDYFGEPPMLLARKGTLRRMAHEGKTGGWHQDGAFMGVDIRSINIWLSLTHCGEDAPGLDVVGRRLDGLVKTGDGAFTDWATTPDAAEEAAAGAIVRPIFEPGDALIFDHLNLHRTAIDPGMVHDRYAIETWLFGPSTYDSMTTTVENGYSPRDQLPIAF